MFPGRSREEIRAHLPATTLLLDLTVDIPLSPMLTQHDLADLEAAMTKVLDHRRLRQPSIASSRHGSIAV
jgi:hypothetical protein